MQGRMEMQLKNHVRTEKYLTVLPSYVSEYYYDVASGLEATSQREFIRIIKDFLFYIDAENTKEIEPETLIRFVGKYLMSKQTKIENGEVKPTSASYQLQIHSGLNSFMEYLYRRKLISSNPVVFIKRTKKKDIVNRVKITKQNLNDILDQTELGYGSYTSRIRQKDWQERDRLILLLFMTTGMRESALASINISDIDFEKKKLKVIDKGAKNHIYEISYLMDDINDWLDKRHKLIESYFKSTGVRINEDPLFISEKRTRISTSAVYKLVCKYSNEAIGEKLSPHKLRAAFCTILYEDTKDIDFVKEAVGHSSIAVTQRYIVSDNEAKKKSAVLMARDLGLV